MSEVPLYGTHKTGKARFWPCFTGKVPKTSQDVPSSLGSGQGGGVCVCVCVCVGVWVCGCVGVWVCGCVGV